MAKQRSLPTTALLVHPSSILLMLVVVLNKYLGRLVIDEIPQVPVALFQHFIPHYASCTVLSFLLSLLVPLPPHNWAKLICFGTWNRPKKENSKGRLRRDVVVGSDQYRPSQIARKEIASPPPPSSSIVFRYVVCSILDKESRPNASFAMDSRQLLLPGLCRRCSGGSRTTLT